MDGSPVSKGLEASESRNSNEKTLPQSNIGAIEARLQPV